MMTSPSSLAPVQLRALAEQERRKRARSGAAWRAAARHDQLPPEGRWIIWLILAGRFWGKTRTGAETINAWARESSIRIAMAGPTAADVRDVMVEGASGLHTLYPDILYEPSKRRLTWPNGSQAILLSADEPERFRGPQYHRAWCDELASWRYPEAFDQLSFGLRLPEVEPRCIVTTTPKPSPIIRGLVARAKKNDGVVLTRGSSYDNRANVSADALAELKARFEGTRIGRQELHAELLEDVPGALWQQKRIDELRVPAINLDTLTRIVVAIDPSVTAGENSDEAGIIVAGVGHDRHGYVLEDLSGIYSPSAWASLAVSALHRWGGDRIIAEVNNGGDLVETTLRTVVPRGQVIPYKKIHASRGKRPRAEPVAALYEQGRVHHVGVLPALEKEQTEWDATNPNAASPNRVDALVWAIKELMLPDVVQPRRDLTWLPPR